VEQLEHSAKRAVKGGRISRVRDKFKSEFTLLDMNSLYPFAMMRIRIPTTKPLVRQPKTDELASNYTETILKDAVQFIIEINITLPKSKKYYTDLQLGLRVLDNIELAEPVRVCDIEYEIIRDYYWASDSNGQLADSLISLTSDNKSDTDSQGDSQINSFEVDKELIKKFIMKHYELKQRATIEIEKNTEKLILNSVFGKCIQKGYKTTTRETFRISITKGGKLVTRDEKYKRYKLIKHDMIQDFDDEGFEVTLVKGYDDIFNNANAGVAVLSESKRLMNQTF
jgi:hypothetical protein